MQQMDIIRFPCEIRFAPGFIDLVALQKVRFDECPFFLPVSSVPYISEALFCYFFSNGFNCELSREKNGVGCAEGDVWAFCLSEELINESYRNSV